MSYNIGIIGCGLIGQKRSKALGIGKLVACADINQAQAERLAFGTEAKIFTDWKHLLALPAVEMVIIATLHDSLAEITLAAIKAGKHVLVEKPAARHAAELEVVMTAAEQNPTIKVRVGFNHRYHRALRNAKQIINEGSLGPLMFLRARYGHGGRMGYEKEWRSNPALSGGGELIDQGPHLIDLARWILGDFTEIEGHAATYFWEMPVDDNGFMLLQTAEKKVAFLHVSCTEWKNIFSMEIYGHHGKLEISGLGGSYGVERLAFYKMLPTMGPPETTIWEYPMEDDSWSVELAEFYDDIGYDRNPAVGLKDAYEVLKIVNIICKKSGYDYSS